jgi:hypothetical protein
VRQATGSGALSHVVAPELTCWAWSCGTLGGSEAPRSREAGSKVVERMADLSPLTWGARIQSWGTCGNVWMHASPLVLTWSLYAGVPDLQGSDSGPWAHLVGGCEPPSGANIFLPALVI